MVYRFDATVASRTTVDFASQQIILTNTPAAYSIQFVDGDIITIPNGRIGPIHRADGQPLGRLTFIVAGGGAGFIEVFENDIYCVELT
jgi:hypothetical protein